MLYVERLFVLWWCKDSINGSESSTSNCRLFRQNFSCHFLRWSGPWAWNLLNAECYSVPMYHFFLWAILDFLHVNMLKGWTNWFNKYINKIIVGKLKRLLNSFSSSLWYSEHECLFFGWIFNKCSHITRTMKHHSFGPIHLCEVHKRHYYLLWMFAWSIITTIIITPKHKYALNIFNPITWGKHVMKYVGFIIC